MPVNTESEPMLEEKQFNIAKKVELQCVNEKSSKTYIASLELSKNDNRAQIFSKWGRIDSENLTNEWRWYDSHEKATKEFESIVKSKKKKGYEEV